MSALRTLFRKYWIVLIILLWVIAWVNRDWLAGTGADTEVTMEEPVSVAVQEAGEPVAAGVQAPAEPAAEKGPGPTAGDRAEIPVASPEAPPVAAEPSSDKLPVSPVTEVSGEEVAAAPTDSVQAALVAPESAPEAEVAASPAVVATPVAQPEAAPAEPGVVRPAELLSQARNANRSRGPRAAAQVLSEGLGNMPTDAPERADLLGELGNFHFAAGDLRRAFQAYEQALMVLTKEERREMVDRLGPVYDRFHPEGRSRLEQFR